MKFFMVWLWKMRWWLLIVTVLVLAYVVGPPKNFAVLEWVKGAFDK